MPTRKGAPSRSVALVFVLTTGLLGCSEPPPVDRVQAFADALAADDGSAACALLFDGKEYPEACAKRIADVQKNAPFLAGARVTVTKHWTDGGDTLSHVVVDARGPRGSGTAHVVLACHPSGTCNVHGGQPLFVLSVSTR
jgi:hypothetical protein